MANVHTTLVTTLPMLVLVACGSMQSYPEAPTEALDTGLEATGESDLDAGDDDDDDDASVVASIAVDAVQPTYGLDLGGEEVTILGGPFTENTTVLFGDDEAEVLSVDDDRLVVVTPSTTAEGHVDIIIRDGEAQGVMPEGYRFWRDATGKAGMVGTVAVVLQDTHCERAQTPCCGEGSPSYGVSGCGGQAWRQRCSPASCSGWLTLPR